MIDFERNEKSILNLVNRVVLEIFVEISFFDESRSKDNFTDKNISTPLKRDFYVSGV